MSLLTVTGLSQGFAEKELYRDASFELYKGEHMGVVGQNGVGKSTLIKILIGEVIPDQALIRWQSNLKIGHLDQYAELDGSVTIDTYLRTAYSELYELETEMERLYEESARTGDAELLRRASGYQERLAALDFYSVGSQINRAVTGLGLDAIGTDRLIGELSGGQRAKVILAKLLLEKPNVLLLDEPTNFLDQEHVEWLEDYLNAFEGAFIVVSHDFDFLEKISTCILDIEFGTIKKYHGRYSEFLKQKSHLREDYLRQYQAQQKKIEETEAYIRKNIAGVNTKMAQGRRKQLSRMERLAPPSFIEKPVFRFREVGLLSQTALTVTGLEVGYYYPLLPKLNLSVPTGQKLVITGFNGIGKSTLLKTLVGALPALSGSLRFAEQTQIGYYEQELQWENPKATPLAYLSDCYPRYTVKELRRFLAQCGVKAEHVSQPLETLSGGEQSKVKLCRLLLTPYNFLILDEVTNHFDAEAKEALQKALIQFRGSVILVCHEESFYKSWADRVFSVEELFD